MTLTITSSLALVTVLRADCQANGGLYAAGADWATGPGRAQLVVTQTLEEELGTLKLAGQSQYSLTVTPANGRPL